MRSRHSRPAGARFEHLATLSQCVVYLSVTNPDSCGLGLVGAMPKSCVEVCHRSHSLGA
jgi:hypothetical protein